MHFINKDEVWPAWQPHTYVPRSCLATFLDDAPCATANSSPNPHKPKFSGYIFPELECRFQRRILKLQTVGRSWCAGPRRFTTGRSSPIFPFYPVGSLEDFDGIAETKYNVCME